MPLDGRLQGVGVDRCCDDALAVMEGLDRARVQELLDRFLSGRADRTLQAYTTDLDDFARFVGEDTATAVSRLLAGGSAAGRRLLLLYAAELRRRGRANATIERRLYTLRAIVRLARDMELVAEEVQLPGDDEVAATAVAGAGAGVPYLFPSHPAEVDRLDVQHFAMRDAVGANHVAPVAAPRRILDVGSGTGQWGFDACAQFPNALVVGIDLARSKDGWPARYRWVRGNVLEGLPFADDRFDFVHQRLMVAAVPVSAWPRLVREAVRVTRPGGWIELVEPMMVCDRPGPATRRLTELALRMASAVGLDTESEVFSSLDRYLQDAGGVETRRRELALPIGWGGSVGSLMATDFRAVNARLTELLRARGELSAEECDDLLRRAQRECEEYRTAYVLAIVIGRKAVR